MTTEDDSAARWVSYRPEIKVLDCTIRDGGLMNDSQFDDATVKAVYDACVGAGIDYMEIGYKGSGSIFARDKFGDWRFCKEDDIRRIVGENDTKTQISVMADAEKTDYKTDILPREQSVIDLVRVACYIHQIPTALDMVKDAHDKGYDTTVNLMSVSVVAESELMEGLKLLAESKPKAIYVVDSFGHLYGEQVRRLVHMYAEIAKKEFGVEVGMHAHNNLQLAFSNTIAAVTEGANYIDSTIGGLGRGAGNCPTELLLSFLHNPAYELRPILECLQDHIEPMRAELQWGFDIPYMVTGHYNRHPRSAMAFKASETPDKFLKFYDEIVQDV